MKNKRKQTDPVIYTNISGICHLSVKFLSMENCSDNYQFLWGLHWFSWSHEQSCQQYVGERWSGIPSWIPCLSSQLVKVDKCLSIFLCQMEAIVYRDVMSETTHQIINKLFIIQPLFLCISYKVGDDAKGIVKKKPLQARAKPVKQVGYQLSNNCAILHYTPSVHSLDSI